MEHPIFQLCTGDSIDELRAMPEESVHCAVTSPPYYGLRNYENADGQLGLEETPSEYVNRLRDICHELKRVLRSDGIFWINIGDSYTGYHGNKKKSDADAPSNKPGYVENMRSSTVGVDNLKNKELMGIPWRVAFALQDDGWYLRSEVIWCLSGGTKVYANTQKGVSPITIRELHRLKPGTVELWTGSHWTPMTAIKKTKRKGTEVKITLRSGERITCSLEHQWPTDRGLLRTKDLIVGDIFKRCTLSDSCEVGVHYIPTNLPFDDIGWLAGMYLAEGCIDSTGTIHISGHKNEIERWVRLERIVDSYQGCFHYIEDSDNGQTMCIDSSVIRSIIQLYISGSSSKNKRLTRKSWQRNNDFLESLINGYLEGDGHWEEAVGRYRLGFCRNYYLESDIRTMCARLGYECVINMSHSKCNGKKFKSFRGEIRKAKSDHHNFKDKGEILKIEKCSTRHFYEISIEDDESLFALSSGILTHNSKPAPMPDGAKDRPTRSHEHVFLFTKKDKYFYDRLPIAEPIKDPGVARKFSRKGNDDRHDLDRIYDPKGIITKNSRGVWTISNRGNKIPHYAQMPTELAKKCVSVGVSEKGCCPACKAPWQRVVETVRHATRPGKNTKIEGKDAKTVGNRDPERHISEKVTLGWEPTCKCNELDEKALVPCVVLDPFSGVATTGLEALKLGHSYVGIDISPDYNALAREQLSLLDPIFVDEGKVI